MAEFLFPWRCVCVPPLLLVDKQTKTHQVLKTIKKHFKKMICPKFFQDAICMSMEKLKAVIIKQSPAVCH